MTTASDGGLLGKFELHGGAAAEVAAAIKTASTFEGEHDTRTRPERLADALHDIAAFYNRQNDKPTTKRCHPHVELSLRGDTLTSNLGLLCSRHHHLAHREKVIVKVLPNAEMHFTWPDGQHRVTQPRGKPPKVPLPPV